MKKIMFLLMAMLMSFGASTFAGTTTDKQKSTTKFDIPVNIIIKQTITFTDGKTISVYYQKQGSTCRLYSKTDLSKYKESDINRVKSTNFEIVDHTEGKCLMTKKAADVIDMARSLIRQVEQTM